jgi:hypothetical protein
MKTKNRFKIFTILAIMLFTGSCKNESGWTPLLDKNLSNWDMYLSYRHKNGYKGDQPVDENGIAVSPVGYNRNESNVFSVIDMNGSPVLRISGEIYGCVFTKQEYENYDLKLKVKWGNKKSEPRMDKLMDSGVLYDSQGECGVDYWRSWMLGQEFQVMEGHMGDYWNIASSAIDIKAFIPEGEMNTVASEKQPFIPVGEGTPNPGFCLRSADYESPAGEWTELELINFNGQSIHIINGHVVMILKNSRYVKDGKSFPLVKGKIQIQSEAAEVFYKDIMIRNLTALPEKYTGYFASFAR